MTAYGRLPDWMRVFDRVQLPTSSTTMRSRPLTRPVRRSRSSRLQKRGAEPRAEEQDRQPHGQASPADGELRPRLGKGPGPRAASRMPPLHSLKMKEGRLRGRKTALIEAASPAYPGSPVPGENMGVTPCTDLADRAGSAARRSRRASRQIMKRGWADSCGSGPAVSAEQRDRAGCRWRPYGSVTSARGDLETFGVEDGGHSSGRRRWPGPGVPSASSSAVSASCSRRYLLFRSLSRTHATSAAVREPSRTAALMRSCSAGSE